MSKEKTISLRCSQGWLDAVDRASERFSNEMNMPSLSRNAFIEFALTDFFNAYGYDDLVRIAKGIDAA